MTETASPPRPSVLRGPARHGILLGLFSLAAALILSLSFAATEAAIAARKAENLLASLRQVLPAALHENDPSQTLRVLQDPKEGQVKTYLATSGTDVTGVAFELTGYGYSGAIRVLIGIAPDGTVLGVRVLSHTETPGLGDKIERRISAWIESFSGKSLSDPAPDGWAVRKDGGSFDQFSGATITPRAVVATVKRGLQLFDAHRATLLQPLAKDVAQ